MTQLLSAVLLACSLQLARAATPIQLSISPPSNASAPIRKSFVSFSIEFSSFPDFAGNNSHPNNFSYNLLNNLDGLQGSKPIIRVGGNTQDYATVNASQEAALIGSYDFNKSKDYPTTISIGPAYFESYNTWPGYEYIHGLNMGKNGTIGYQTLVQSIPLICKALPVDKLATSPTTELERICYVAEYIEKTRLIRDTVKLNCPEVIESGKLRYYSPSFAGTSNSLNIIKTFQVGLDEDGGIAFIDSHNYMGGATQPGVTLQKTLMNHTAVVLNVNKHLNESTLLKSLAGIDLPYLLGETNSLYNQGAPALSNSFGAALWGVDFNLYCAATGIARVHMHQGNNYRYAAWQPVDTANETIGTKAPYYGNVMVASFLGNLTAGNVSVANIDLGNTIYESAYAAYVDDRLERIALIHMQEYNYTVGGPNAGRQKAAFTLRLPVNSGVSAVDVSRLIANGSNAITGVTFGGVSYNYELNVGRPVKLANTTAVETIKPEDGSIEIDLPWSSAVILQLKY
ncbi:Beta-glucuronidase [Cyphellophora attinorum]|uniref:Beta-glucuronidase n=1 Tax=Cyphellophora attinorum TaxID=1664694 RepID=A0A0N1H3K5_9EURO|nr:Beta-glucuronidase [Phialophora attinorum]KPI35447.1 Beta-glucuronidase [Phialophora attinorum]